MSVGDEGNVALKRDDDTSKPNIPALIAQIRSRVKANIEDNRDFQKPFKPSVASDGTASRKAGELLYSEELRYLNQHYAFGPNLNLDSVTSHRPGIIGGTIVRIKRKLLTLVWDLLKSYFTAEREFHANLVRYLNDVSKYVDARDASNFWELIKKIDYDVTKALERIERINDEQMASIRSSERRMFDTLSASLTDLLGNIRTLGTTAAQHDDKLKTLDSVTSGLESIIARIGKGISIAPNTPSTGGDQELPDYSYLLLENRYRGSEAEIGERLRTYLPLFTSGPKPVLEIGVGRGELQALFREGGIPSYGVDVDGAMVEACREKGFSAQLEDGITHLRSLPEESLSGVIAIQVVEHLTRGQLEELLSLTASRVIPGGVVVFETINPRSLLALSSNYFRDPTHVFPLHPDTLSYQATLAGLSVREVRYLSPVPDAARLQKLPVQEYMTPQWAFAIESLNKNFEQLNELLYGYQDYALVACVPER